jgi:hypothetical protein
LTRIAETHAPDATYDEVRRHFEDKELVDGRGIKAGYNRVFMRKQLRY